MKNKRKKPVRKFPENSLAFKAPYSIHEIVEKWVEENEENSSVLLRQALKLGLIEMGLLAPRQSSGTDNEIS